MKDIFQFQNYKAYLKQKLSSVRGFKSRAANAASIQTTYLSRVLNGEADLSMEQAMDLSGFLNHNVSEKNYFLLLVQYERAGTPPLKAYFKEKLDEVIVSRQELKNRLVESENLSQEDQTTYYSQWYYSAIHVASSIPEFQSREVLSQALNLPIAVINKVVEFLSQRGLLVQEGERIRIGPRHLHLGADSEMVLQHHSNWRRHCLHRLEFHHPKDFHYSGVLSLSKEDAQVLKERMLQVIQDNLKTVAPSKEETLICSMVDLYELSEL